MKMKMKMKIKKNKKECNYELYLLRVARAPSEEEDWATETTLLTSSLTRLGPGRKRGIMARSTASFTQRAKKPFHSLVMAVCSGGRRDVRDALAQA
jgi:hypothetical protein